MRIIIDVDSIQECERIQRLLVENFPNIHVHVETAGQQILRTMREHKYNPDKDPMIKRFNDRIDRL